MEGQDEFIMRKSDNADVGLGEVDEEEVLADAQRAVGHMQYRFVRRQP